ncbi:MAG: hybrid sensor histidine kinase/response regulator [Proteobacteria bacterium SG_bin9]|nr:MAG: hybrid sensor histidine kinase/response regulator [Proteobacteria bacterium SG_bin9]
MSPGSRLKRKRKARKAPKPRARKALPLVKRSAIRKRAKSKSAKPRGGKPAPRLHQNAIEAALAAFAHEVRTPLTGILAVSDLLATSDLDERERRWVDTIKAGAEHLAGLATLFVDAARSGHAELGVRQDFFDLRILARTAGDSLAGRAAAKGLRPTVTVSDTLPPFAIGDAIRLRAALENLIDNAVKFTERGEVGLDVAAKSLRGRKVAVTFTISDSGIGLSLAEIKKLFKPFSQANVSIAARFGGAGLGLSSVKQIARAMGGDITAAARDGGGTVFTLTVVLQHADLPKRAASDICDAGVTGLHVLSVEDNPFGRVVLNAILTELGHVTEFVSQGEVALERLLRGGFDVVLMDMVLPGINGVETIRRIRALAGDPGRVAVIGVSGRNSDEAAALAAGAHAFLVKPVSPRSLAAALQAATRRAAAASS